MRSRAMPRAMLVEPCGVEQGGRRHLHRVGIGDVIAHVGDAELQRLDLKMQRAPGCRARRPSISQPLEQAERDKRSDALAVRRDLVDAVAAELHVDRVEEVDRVRGQVVLADEAAAILRRARDLRRDLAAIEILAFGLGDLCRALPP